MSQVRFTLSKAQAAVLKLILEEDRQKGGLTSTTTSGRRVYERIRERMIVHQVWSSE